MRSKNAFSSNCRNLYFGWMATYELWDITGHPRRIKHISVGISAQELSLAFPSTLPGRFPMRIYSDLSTFSILRTVHRAGTSSTNSAPNISSVVLDTGYENYRGIQASKDQTRRSHRSMKVDSGPKYCINLSHNGHFACLYEPGRMSTFRLAMEGSKITTKLLSYMRHRVLGGRFCMHNDLPLVAFFGESGIYVWDFELGMFSSTKSYKQSP